MTTRIKSFTDLRDVNDFVARFEYLRTNSRVGVATFGFERYLNQRFYTSVEWRHARNQVIIRDRGCDLGIDGHEVYDKIIIHHMNPITVQQIETGDTEIFDPEFLISVSHPTHNAIHYGDASLLAKPLIVRRPGDTKLW
jgi:hypothetical protein